MIDAVFRGNIILEHGVVEGGYLAVQAGKIVSISEQHPGPADHEQNYEGAWIFPGAIDAQTHARSQKGREGFHYATKAAAAGGVTTIVDMPYDEGLLVCDAQSFRSKAADVAVEAHVDVGLHGTIRVEDGIGKIPEQVEAGVCGFKFSTFGTHPERFPRIPPALMQRAFAAIAPHGLPAGVHNENDEIVRYELAEIRAAGRTDYLAHGMSHTPLSELLAMAEIYEIGANTGCHAHVVHCSQGRGIEICESYRRQGFAASVEVCIHYLVLSEDEDVSRLGGLAKVNPPIRPRADREALWRHLAAGNIELVSTDHVAWSLERKNDPDMLKNASGGPSLEVLVPLMIRECLSRDIDLGTAARVLAGNPSRHFRIERTKGALRVGTDADFCIIDPAMAPYRAETTQSVSEWSVYEGMELPQIRATYLRGAQIWNGAEVTREPGFGALVKPYGRE